MDKAVDVSLDIIILNELFNSGVIDQTEYNGAFSILTGGEDEVKTNGAA